MSIHRTRRRGVDDRACLALCSLFLEHATNADREFLMQPIDNGLIERTQRGVACQRVWRAITKLRCGWRALERSLRLAEARNVEVQRAQKHGMILRCRTCNREWEPEVTPSGRLRRRYWQCPAGCNATSRRGCG